ncbi:hypothetical protein RB597_005297 [Gaeumannomyces tritici]
MGSAATGRSWAWEEKSARCRGILARSLNQDRLPPPTQRNVVGFIESCGALSARELEITARDGRGLVAEMAAGRLSAVETTTAFLKRAHVAHQLANLATEFLVEDALRAARELDAHFAATGRLKGPLHGLPISVKEHIALKGRIVHSSYVALADNVMEEDALIITLARNAGAVIHVRTNIPQTVMMIDCANPIYGETVNPHNRDLTPGGSSGAEGASLGLRCAALGLGTDIGGSVRVPAAFCGAYGIKTTSLRNPYGGITLPGLARRASAASSSPTPHPPVTRALKKAVAAAKAAGFDMVDWEPHEHERCLDILKDLYFPDAAATQRDLLAEGGEPIPAITRWTLETAPAKPLSLAETWALNLRRDGYRDAHYRLMRECGVDAILCPAYVGAAAVCGTGQHIMYTAMWNILDYPSVTFRRASASTRPWTWWMPRTSRGRHTTKPSSASTCPKPLLKRPSRCSWIGSDTKMRRTRGRRLSLQAGFRPSPKALAQPVLLPPPRRTVTARDRPAVAQEGAEQQLARVFLPNLNLP